MAESEKILLVQTSFLGDLVLTTPLLAEIRRRFPRAQISILCRRELRDVLAADPEIYEVISYDKRGPRGGWTGLWRMAQDLRARGFGVALSVHKSLRTALLLFLAGIPLRVGFRQSAGWFLYHLRPRRAAAGHDVERSLSLLSAVEIDPRTAKPALRVEVSAEVRADVERIFRACGIRGDGIIFGLNPGSVWATKRWTPEGYAALIRRLRASYGGEVLLFGGPDDREVVERILDLSNHGGTSLVGKIGLRELAGAIERCHVFITNDSGPMHIAVARGVPTAAIFCATTPALGFYPYGANAVVIEKTLSCRPCAPHGGLRCPLGTEDCMRLISAADVMRGVDLLLNPDRRRETGGVDSGFPRTLAV
jgi:heptosyltransferase-2